MSHINRIQRLGRLCYNLNLCHIFENMTSFSPIFNQELERGKLMAAIDSQKERSKKRALYVD